MPFAAPCKVLLVRGIIGIGQAVEAFRHGSGGQRALALVVALVAVLAGPYAITSPGATAVLLTWVLGIWLLVRGVVEGVGAFRTGLAGSARLLLGLGAVVDLVLGVLFVANPRRAALSLGPRRHGSGGPQDPHGRRRPLRSRSGQRHPPHACLIAGHSRRWKRTRPSGVVSWR